jgi:hypothetical protein
MPSLWADGDRRLGCSIGALLASVALLRRWM